MKDQPYHRAREHLFRLMMLILLLVSPLLSALALPPNAPPPGSSSSNPSSLGLTGDYNVSSTISASKNASSLNGVRLDLSRQGAYYFYLYLESTSTINLKLYSDQNLSTKGQMSLRLLDSKRKEITRASTVTCTRNQPPCTAVLMARNQPAGAYTIQLDLPVGRGKSAWLSQVITAGTTTLDGTSYTKALAWFNQDDVFGQAPANVSNHWYKVNLTAGKKYALKLLGSKDSNIKLYVYSDTNTSKPIASVTSGSYPRNLSLSVPGSAKFVYLKVENASKSNVEYFIQYTR